MESDSAADPKTTMKYNRTVNYITGAGVIYSVRLSYRNQTSSLESLLEEDIPFHSPPPSTENEHDITIVHKRYVTCCGPPPVSILNDITLPNDYFSIENLNLDFPIRWSSRTSFYYILVYRKRNITPWWTRLLYVFPERVNVSRRLSTS